MPSVLKTSKDQKMKLMGSWSLPSKNLTDSWKKSKRKQALKLYMYLYCCIRCSDLCSSTSCNLLSINRE